MTEILNILFNPLPNAIMSGLMIVTILYWLASFLGIGFGDFDFGIDVDTDVDANIDTEVNAANTEIEDTHAENTTEDNIFIKFLKFINIGKVPFMLVLSTLKFFTWAGSIITTQFTIVGSWGAKSVLILIPIFFIAAFLTKYATTPVAKFLKKTGYHGEEEIDFLGRSGKMLSSIKGEKIGNAEFLIEKNPMKLNVVSHTGEEIKYGDKVMITDESQDKKIYYITKEITL